MKMRFLLYDIATTLAVPFVATRLCFSSQYRPLLGRFHPEIPVVADRPLWVHACSVGEVSVAKPIIQHLTTRTNCTPQDILLTVSTIFGMSAATGGKIPASITWCPFDQKHIVANFIDKARPKLLVLVETELWPNLIRCCSDAGIPVAIVNGRISDKHYPRYKRLAKWLQPVFSCIALACVQNDEYAARFVELGVPESALRVTGNTKFDGVSLQVDAALVAQLRRSCGIPDDASVLVFGSTRPGDEQLAASCWSSLKHEFPNLRLVIVPRHIERTKEILTLFPEERVLLRSAVKQGGCPNGERIVIVDTMGELVSFYAMATLAVIGGSFFPGVNGHNPLESAALGVPTIFGPFMRNFIDPARVLVGAGGACQVSQPKELEAVLRRLLQAPEERNCVAARGREAVLANRGAIDRTLDALLTLVKDRSQ